MRRTLITFASTLVLLAAAGPAPYSASVRQDAPCTPGGSLTQLPDMAEASGLALSRRVPGRLWAHNDSGQPVLFALDGKGAITGRVRVTGAAVEDWEGIASGPCGNGDCLYIGDIGDNEAGRRNITVYRVAEPETASGTAAVAGVLRATYPDGPHDAETLLAGPDGRLYIVTKGETGPVGVYRFPAQPQDGATIRLERVGGGAPKPDADSRITDGSMSADGQWVVIRSRSALTFHRAAEFLAGQWRPAATVDVRPLKEPQGEGVAFGSGTIFLASEGGGKGRPGTFARFSCAPPGR